MELIQPCRSPQLAVILRQLVVDTFDSEIVAEDIGDDTNLFDLGIDSLGAVRLVMSIEEKLQVEIPESILTGEMFERFANLVEVVGSRVGKLRDAGP